MGTGAGGDHVPGGALGGYGGEQHGERYGQGAENTNAAIALPVGSDDDQDLDSRHHENHDSLDSDGDAPAQVVGSGDGGIVQRDHEVALGGGECSLDGVREGSKVGPGSLGRVGGDGKVVDVVNGRVPFR